MKACNEYIIVGGGPVGLSVSMLLLRKGHSVKVYDKRKDPRINSESGRSINLALSNRGFKTLALLGLEEIIKSQHAVSMSGRTIHSNSNQTNFQPYSENNECIYSVSRSELNILLLDEAEKSGIEIVFNAKCLNFVDSKETLVFEEFEISTNGKSILACDGAFSPLRNSLKILSGFSHKETKLDYGYQEFTIPPDDNSGWQLEKHSLHIWPRKDFMLIALPNTDGSFTCTLFLRLAGEHAFENIKDINSAKSFFIRYFPDAYYLIKDFDQQIKDNPISALFMETCSPWNLDNKLLLLGDAAHAIVPFYGQGLNAGLEDVDLFIEAVENGLTENLFSSFQKQRKPDTDAIGELALHNFIEMRDLVTDDIFMLKKKIEHRIKELFPSKWKTQYEQVTFSSLPYLKAQRNGRENDKKLTLILENEILTDHLLNNKITEQDMYLLSSIIM
ncbi:MAG: FAD-dependent monooxygenase [Opitutaceae bacterium]|nr:FAD-dependent monooxygenase [Cytophagales bacterium]